MLLKRGELTSIDEVVRGKTNLACLYCGGGLTAKKGSVKEHHFAHTEETCKPVSQRIKTKAFPALPLYDNFTIQLKGEELEQLKVLWKEYGAQGYAIPRDLVNFRWQLKPTFRPLHCHNRFLRNFVNPNGNFLYTQVGNWTCDRQFNLAKLRKFVV